MAVPVSTVRPDAFGAFLHATRFALLLVVGWRPPFDFPRGVAPFFAKAYPGHISLGRLRHAEVRQLGWFDATFRSRAGPMRGGVGEGYYLFDRGLVIGHHMGIVNTRTVSVAPAELEAQRARVIRFGFAGVGAQDEVVEHARQVIVTFDGLLGRRLGEAHDASERWVRDDERERTPPPRGRRATSEPPPPRAPAPAASDPFVVLGLARTATLAEAKAAFKEQMKLNHPDKVAHLSPALQAFAQAQVLEIKAAYDAVRKRLGSAE